MNLLPPGTDIKQEDQSPEGKESDLKHLSTQANIIGMEEGSEKYKRPKITLEALKVNIQNGKYVSSLSKQPHLHMNEDMYTPPGIHYSYSGFDTLTRMKNPVYLSGQSNTAISEARVSDGSQFFSKPL